MRTALWAAVLSLALVAPGAAQALARAEAPLLQPTAELAATRTRLAAIARRGFEDPAAALAELEPLRPADLGSTADNDWLFTRGRVLLASGAADAAAAVAVQLTSRTDGAGSGWLLRALVQEHAGQPAGALARRAVAAMDARCPAGDEPRAVRELGCDYRAAWEALQLLQREQSGLGGFAEAEATTRRALALAEAGSDGLLIALSHARLALLLQGQDRPDEARAALRSALAVARSDNLAAARVRNLEAILESRAGNVAGSRAALEAALKLAERAGAPHLAAQLRSNLVDVYAHQGLLKEAQAAGQQALPLLLRFGDRPFLRTLRHNLALVYIRLRQFDAARQEIANVAELGTDPSDLINRARGLRELGDAWADVGQHREALAAYQAERELTARAGERNRATALEELRRKYDTAARQRDLELLARDGQLKDQQLANRRLAQQLGLVVGGLLLLSAALIGFTLLRMRRAQARLTANQGLLRVQSERDPLTNLSNRRHFLAAMEARAREVGGDGFEGVLMMIDIDHFKSVNDVHGHAAGDAVIVEVGRRIGTAVRDTDLVVRWGGEEFLVVTPPLPAEDVARMASRMLDGVGGQLVETPAGPLRVNVSIGFARFPLGTAATAGPALQLHWEQAVNWADAALYRAKAEGRNRGLGIVAVEAADADALAAVLQGFDAACANGQVTLDRVAGPA